MFNHFVSLSDEIRLVKFSLVKFTSVQVESF